MKNILSTILLLLVTVQLFAVYGEDSVFVYGKEFVSDALSADTTETHEEQKEMVEKDESVAKKQVETPAPASQNTSVFVALLVFISFVLVVLFVVWAIRRRKHGRG